MLKSRLKRCSVKLRKDMSPTMIAEILGVSLLAHPKDGLSFFLSSHNETPTKRKQAAVFAFIVSGVAPQVLRLAM